MPKTTFDRFKEKLLEIEHLSAGVQILDWDAQVNMPHKGSAFRGATVATLSTLIHEKMLSDEFESLLLKLKKDSDKDRLTPQQSAIVREVYRVYQKEKKLPAAFVRELSEAISAGHNIWVEARKRSDFKIFAPHLKKIVELKRKQAKLQGYAKLPYDGLLDDFEPGLTSDELSLIFAELKNFLVPFLKRIKNSGKKFNTKALKGNYSLEKQKEFNKAIAQRIGYDFDAGRMDVSAHPFTSSFNPYDARITTRYDEKDVYYSLGSTIHEVGHALYEQGLLPEHFGTPLGNAASLGIHESQSRVWENLVGKSLNFWKYFYPVLQKHFPQPFNKLQLEKFYQIINQVEPSFIRVEADEVTYNLHIIIRFEIEKELIEGSINVDDLPKIWNSKYKDYLGIKVTDDAQGVLQDVHWSSGLFGYFPTYTLGNLYSAQFYQQAQKDIMNMEAKFAKGHFQPFLEWLRKNIHQHGKFYSAAELCNRITGEGLNSKYYADYLTNKYTSLYQL